MNFIEDNQRLKIFLNVVVLTIALIGISRKGQVYQKTSSFDNLMISIFAPAQKGVTIVKGRVASIFDHYFDNVEASQNNIGLHKEIEILKEQLFSVDEVSKENLRLKELLGLKKQVTHKKVLAQVVAIDASSSHKVLRINKGMSDGIKIQSTVVTANGIVGYIYRLTDHFADVLTILDSNNRVDSLIQRTRTHGIVEGLSTDKCTVKYVGRTEPVILNDLVVTSGLGNIYPKGLVIGSISKIERESYGTTQYVELTPAVDFTKLEEVVVLIGEGDAIKRQELKILNGKDNE